MITVLLLLILKHFVCDGPLQTQYQIDNKGTYGHIGGIVHAATHGLGTLLCFFHVGIGFETALWLGIFDMLIHYHIDWVKMKYGCVRIPYSEFRKNDLGRPCLCIYDNKFFLWLLADQCLHFATYVFLTFVPILQLG